MSTILDALRKLQGDRDGVATPPRRDLRSSVLDAPLPPPRVQRPEPKVRPLIAALGGGAVMAACIGGFLVWNGREADPFERAAGSAVTPDATLVAEAPPPPPVEPPPPRAPEPLVNLAAPPAPPPETPEARYAAFQPPAPDPEPPQPTDTNSASGPMLEPGETFPDVLARARPAGAPRQAREAGNPGYGSPQDYKPPRIMTRAEADAERAQQQTALESAAMDRARQRLAQSEPSAPVRRPARERREEPAPAPPPPPRETAQVETPPEPPTAPDAATSLLFPVIEVQSVLWHPDPQRRQATILLDGQLTADAREGDLIGGVFVTKITPGSVEFRMGQETRRVDMAP